MIYLELQRKVRDAVQAVLPEVNGEQVLVRPCPDARFGDYQVTALMGLAKAMGRNPRQLAGQVASQLAGGVPDWEPAEVAGGGFLNFRLRPESLTRALWEEAEKDGLFYRPTDSPRTVVVDFSSPNVAKPMHVGHIRSTVLGDCLARTLRLLGHRVITDNHIGDWGTQFGKLLVGWKRHLERASLEARPLEEMERLYRVVNGMCADDPSVLEEARAELVRLQRGDGENHRIWQQMIQASQVEFDRIYARLGVHFDHWLGESFYNDGLATVVEDLAGKGLARESEGALVVFFEHPPELRAHPAIVRKSDGAANYATTDLATLEYRWRTWKPDEILYVTDARQQLHFRQVFAIFQLWHPEATVRLEHVWFGSILGEDGKPFKTRSGDTIKLAELLDEAEERAFQVVTQKSPDRDESTRREIARIVGVGAVKYADLLPNRQSDYVFSWDRMLALSGNTAPYLQYAYTRIRSIFRRGAQEEEGGAMGEVGTRSVLRAEEEVALAKHLLNFGLVLETVAAEARPNHLCSYLYGLAGKFARFYEECPVLKAGDSDRANRRLLCELTAKVIRQGLDVLGIETSDTM